MILEVVLMLLWGTAETHAQMIGEKSLEPGLVDRPFGVDDQTIEIVEEGARNRLHQE